LHRKHKALSSNPSTTKKKKKKERKKERKKTIERSKNGTKKYRIHSKFVIYVKVEFLKEQNRQNKAEEREKVEFSKINGTCTFK
jgi:hypothetical protein